MPAVRETIDAVAREQIKNREKICSMNVANITKSVDHLTNEVNELKTSVTELRTSVNTMHGDVKNGLMSELVKQFKKELSNIVILNQPISDQVNRDPKSRSRKRDVSNWSRNTKIVTGVIGTPFATIILVGFFRVIGEGFLWISAFIESFIK